MNESASAHLHFRIHNGVVVGSPTCILCANAWPAPCRLRPCAGGCNHQLRSGVDADVVIRAARDALGLDLQKLVHEDMAAHFEAYPANKAWGSKKPDSNIDHRRVLNLEAYFTRAGARVWKAAAPTPGDRFPPPLLPGDLVTWLLDDKLPHIGIIVSVPVSGATVVHNIGAGAQEWLLAAFSPHRAVAHYRWPAETIAISH